MYIGFGKILFLAFLVFYGIFARMLERRLQSEVVGKLDQFPAVALLGPRQVGKTTLAQIVAEDRPSLYLDLESQADRQKLSDPLLYLSAQEDKLVILDEVQRMPGLFQDLRGLIDQGRRRGRRAGRFLLLGSASIELLQQSGETLSGRIAYMELGPFDILETDPEANDTLWLRGGFPDSFLARDNSTSADWRENFIRTYLERDIPQLGPRLPAETLRRFWTMLAHNQGGLLNAAQLGRGLSVDGKTIVRYLDLMVDLLLVRRLEPWLLNIGKRLVKSPKVYVRDSGIVHTLLGLDDLDTLLGHPIVGNSWEGFVIDTLLNLAPSRARSGFYRTVAGAEMDMILEMPGGELWTIEVKRSLTPKPGKGFHHANDDLKPARSFVVYAGKERYPLAEDIEAISLRELADLLSAMR